MARLSHILIAFSGCLALTSAVWAQDAPPPKKTMTIPTDDASAPPTKTRQAPPMIVKKSSPPATKHSAGSPQAMTPASFKRWCEYQRRAHASARVLCIDLMRTPYTQNLPNGRHVIPPNHSIVVAVRHANNLRIQIDVGGTAGTFEPTIGGKSQMKSGKKNVGFDNDPVPVPVVTTQSYAPRQPGSVPVTVKSNGIEISKVELVVDKAYSGAFRLGFAGVFGDAVDRAFDVRRLPGSNQGQIVATNRGKFDMEILLGYAPFFDRGGRAYYANPSAWGYIAPYIGLGVVATDPESGDLQFLKSFHMGIEWEIARNFSVAVTGVVRRVNGLGDGAKVGGPSGAENIPMFKEFRFGVGLVINISPDIMQVGRGMATSVSSGSN